MAMRYVCSSYLTKSLLIEINDKAKIRETSHYLICISCLAIYELIYFLFNLNEFGFLAYFLCANVSYITDTQREKAP